MKILVNRAVINKSPADLGKYNDKWETIDVNNAEEFIRIIKQGYATAINEFFDNNRQASHFKHANGFYIDVDNKADSKKITTIDDIFQLGFIQQYAWFIATTPNSTPTTPRFHVYFKFKEDNNLDIETFNDFVLKVIDLLEGYGITSIDRIARDVTRLSFGNLKADTFVISNENTISLDDVEQIINQNKIIDELSKDIDDKKITLEEIEYYLSFFKLFKEKFNKDIPYDTWYKIVSGVGNYLKNNELANKILAKFMPDKPGDKKSTRYQLEHPTREHTIGTLIYWSRIYYGATKLNLYPRYSIEELEKKPQLYISDFYREFNSLFPRTIQRKVQVDINDTNVFWYEQVGQSGEPKLVIDAARIRRFIEQHGFAFLQEEFNETELQLIQIVNDIASPSSLEQIHNFLTARNGFIANLKQDYVTNTFKKDDLLDLARQKVPSIFTKSNINYLPIRKSNPLRDSCDEAFFFFQNGIVRVNANSITLHPYSEFANYLIWNEKIINFNIEVNSQFTLTPFVENPYENHFLDYLIKLTTQPDDVSNFDATRLDALLDAIGYLLHNYKDPSNAKIIIITEKTISEKAEGRTGKSLLFKSLSHLRRFAHIEGKSLEQLIKSNFTFQTIDPRVDIVYFDDVAKNFDLENFYSIISSDLPIEQKYKQRYYLPFRYAPKFALSSNYPLSANNDSDRARRHVVELDRFFNIDNRPNEYYGVLFKSPTKQFRLFDDWDALQWNSFYNTLFAIVRRHFQRTCRLETYDTDTLRQSQLRTATSQAFIDFIETIELDRWYTRMYLTREFVTQQGLVANDTTLNSNSKLLGRFYDKYCEIYRLHKHEARTHWGGRHILFSHQSKIAIEVPKDDYNIDISRNQQFDILRQ